MNITFLLKQYFAEDKDVSICKLPLFVTFPKILCNLCDGKNYYATPTTRDREVVQPSVLKGLDWKIVRVWSMDWLNNPDSVIDQIVTIL